MKKLLFVMLLAAVCFPASAELAIYRMTIREGLGVFDAELECPKVRLTETMWLVLDIDYEALEELECGDIADLGGEAVLDAAVFKAWSFGGVKFFDAMEVEDLYIYILSDDIAVVTEFCGARCIMEGKLRRNDVPRSLKGYLQIEDGTYIGEGTCNARFSSTLKQKGIKQGWEDIYDAFDYLYSIQPNRAVEGDMCDPLGLDFIVD